MKVITADSSCSGRISITDDICRYLFYVLDIKEGGRINEANFFSGG